MVKVVLVQPRLEMHSSPPLGIAYVASMLEKHNIAVRIVDLNQRKYIGKSFSILKAIFKNEQPQVVGISCLSSYYNQAKAIARLVKTLDRKVQVVMGGVHPSVLPKLVLQDSNVDFVVIGEGEFTMLELCKNLQKEKNYCDIKGLGFKEKGKIIVNEQRELIENLDELPFPSWHLVPPSEYPPAPQGFIIKKYPVAPIITSRGCPYACTYCASNRFWRRRWRARSPENVISEIKFLVEKYGVKEIEVVDDNFTYNRARALKICEGLIREKIDIQWTCPNGLRVDRIDRKLLQKMKNAGCYHIVLGIESLSDTVLRKVGRNMSLKTIKDAVTIAKKEGMIVGGFFIFGLPLESNYSASKTIELSLKLGLDWAQYFVFTPLPGSLEFSKWIEKDNIDVSCLDFSSFNILRGNVEHFERSLSLRDLRRIKNTAFLRFYMRPHILVNILRRLKPSQVTWLVRRLIVTLRNW